MRRDPGLPVRPVYGPDEVRAFDPRIGWPGIAPFTGDNVAEGYRKKLWMFRQYSGFGTAEGSNARCK
ncbi:methylmalonyl-CoA mutase family protein [Streptomyces sp. NPDC001984]|uniref:methylmalonyl-CoA mutase family protein n=1 Tax=Streptomyces sp. NPDC002619 TaxID=3364655 RepID=UPI0036CDDB42